MFGFALMFDCVWGLRWVVLALFWCWVLRWALLLRWVGFVVMYILIVCVFWFWNWLHVVGLG